MAAPNPSPRKPLVSRLKRYLFTGILVTAPAFITLYALIGLFRISDRWIKSLIPANLYESAEFLLLPGMGLCFLLAILMVVGYLATGWLGRKLVSVTDRTFKVLPVASTLYGSIKQIFSTLLGDNSIAFSEVVFVEYPRRGCWVIAFVTGTLAEPHFPGEMVFVFVPTTPNPTSGFIVLVERSELRPANMTIEQAMRAVVSLGITH